MHPVSESCDVVVVGGGPAGHQAALTLARGNKRVVIVDGGPRRNAAASAVHGLFGLDHVAPDELRRIGRDQLAHYGGVVVDGVATDVSGSVGAFVVEVEGGAVINAKRVVIAGGVVDVPIVMEGMARHWGRSVFICPYCHGYELRGRPWGVLLDGTLPPAHATMFTRMLRGWSDDVTAFVAAGVDVDEAALREAGIRVERRAIVALLGDADALSGVRVDGGDVVTVNALLVRPKQEPTPLVQTLAARGLKLDGAYIAVDEMKRSSWPGISATGDAITPGQSAALGVGAGAFVAGAVNLELSA